MGRMEGKQGEDKRISGEVRVWPAVIIGSLIAFGLAKTGWLDITDTEDVKVNVPITPYAQEFHPFDSNGNPVGDAKGNWLKCLAFVSEQPEHHAKQAGEKIEGVFGIVCDFAGDGQR